MFVETVILSKIYLSAVFFVMIAIGTKWKVDCFLQFKLLRVFIHWYIISNQFVIEKGFQKVKQGVHTSNQNGWTEEPCRLRSRTAILVVVVRMCSDFTDLEIIRNGW